MTIYKIYDNGGKTFDRYTVLTEPGHFGKFCECLSLSNNCDSPQGFSQWGDCYEGSHLGKVVSLDSLPYEVQRHIVRRTE